MYEIELRIGIIRHARDGCMYDNYSGVSGLLKLPHIQIAISHARIGQIMEIGYKHKTTLTRGLLKGMDGNHMLIDIRGEVKRVDIWDLRCIYIYEIIKDMDTGDIATH